MFFAIHGMRESPGRFLRSLFDVALSAVGAARCVPEHVPAPCKGRTVIVGAGKAAAAMARVFEETFTGAVSGAVVVPDGHGCKTSAIDVLLGSHPVPDERCVAASNRILEIVGAAGDDDQVICLLSGGGSSLLCLPGEGVSLEQKRALSHELLASGADISEINCVRRHLSGIKGGRLGAFCAPARCLTLAISDVPGDEPAAIASGPTVADSSTAADAIQLIRKYGLEHHREALVWLNDSRCETIKPGDSRLAHCEFRIIARASDALHAAADAVSDAGLACEILGSDLQGDASQLGREHCRQVQQLLREHGRPDRPLVLLSGGETTVRVTGGGAGGRNTEYLLGLATCLAGQRGVHALACDTDGLDGNVTTAGAIYTQDMASRWLALQMDPTSYLQNNDSAGFFTAMDGLLNTGPTLTNVNDFRAILLMPEAWHA